MQFSHQFLKYKESLQGVVKNELCYLLPYIVINLFYYRYPMIQYETVSTQYRYTLIQHCKHQIWTYRKLLLHTDQH